MATDASFIEYVCDCAQLRGLTFRKMFGEYALYLDARIVALVCDNSVFLKPTAASRSTLRAEPAARPFPGAKPYHRIDELLDDTPLLQRLLRETAAQLPPPKEKPAKAPKPRRGVSAKAAAGR